MPGCNVIDDLHIFRNPVLAFSHFGEKAFKAAGCQNDKMAGGRITDDTECVFRAARDKGCFSRTANEPLTFQPEFHIAGENDECFVSIVMDMPWRTGIRW